MSNIVTLLALDLDFIYQNFLCLVFNEKDSYTVYTELMLTVKTNATLVVFFTTISQEPHRDLINTIYSLFKL
jgi:hypothetical protein